MRSHAIPALLLLLAISGAACAPSGKPLILRGVTVVDPRDGSLRPEVDIEIRGTKIVAVGPRRPAPAESRVIDGRGRFAIPGLADMHVHLAADAPLPLGPENLARNGVAVARDMGGRFPEILALRDSILRGERLGPRLQVAGPTLNGSPEAGFHRVVRTPAEAGRAVAELRGAGVDFIKVHNALAPATFFAICRAARPAGLPVVGHVPHGVSNQAASDSGMRSLEHAEAWIESELFRADDPAPGIAAALDRLAGASGAARFETLRRNGTALTPTLSAYRSFVESQEDPARRDLGERLYRRLAAIVRAADSAGVVLLAGTDTRTDPGPSLHRELELLVAAGLTPLAALQSATIRPGAFLGSPNDGAIAPGSVADVVLLEGNPLADIGNTRRIAAVVVNGRVVDTGTPAARDLPAAPRPGSLLAATTLWPSRRAAQ